MPDDRLSAVVPARVEIVAVAPGEMTTLRNLFQFYEYDFSEIEGAAIGDDGRFHQLEHAEFERAYFVRADGALAGFALVNRRASRVIDGEAGVVDAGILHHASLPPRLGGPPRCARGDRAASRGVGGDADADQPGRSGVLASGARTVWVHGARVQRTEVGLP